MALSFILSLWLNSFSCSFSFSDLFEWFIKQFTEGFQNIQEQMDVNVAIAFNIFPQKHLFICPAWKTRKGVRLKKPLCWLREFSAQSKEKDTKVATQSFIWKHLNTMFCCSISPSNGDNRVSISVLTWAKQVQHIKKKIASHTQNTETSLVTIHIIIYYS